MFDQARSNSYFKDNNETSFGSKSSDDNTWYFYLLSLTDVAWSSPDSFWGCKISKESSLFGWMVEGKPTFILISF